MRELRLAWQADGERGYWEEMRTRTDSFDKRAT
jgi:hypothetical protein